MLHFAGSIRVEESVAAPLAYYRNTTGNSLTLPYSRSCVAHGVEAFIFSSTAAVYGQAGGRADRPLNPYGHSKLMTEQMLRDAGLAHWLRHVILRYFNVAGADPEGRSGLDPGRHVHSRLHPRQRRSPARIWMPSPTSWQADPARRLTAATAAATRCARSWPPWRA